MHPGQRDQLSMRSHLARGVSLLAAVLLCGCAGLHRQPQEQEQSVPQHYVLTADLQVSLNLPGVPQFQASGLLFLPSGELLTINDRSPTLYRVQFHSGAPAADLVPVTECFGSNRMAQFRARDLDCEGIARDSAGRLYICEEDSRSIFRCDPAKGNVERLPIDWTPVARFFSSDRNASFEGIAIGNDTLYVANERSDPVIIVVDLGTLRVVDSFVVQPLSGSFLGILHYSDLSWHNGHLFVLCRHHRVIVEVDPRTRRVVAEFDYRNVEEQLAYRKRYPTGIMEGLAVDDDTFWLVTDNNGMGLNASPADTRPILLRCRRTAITSVPASQSRGRSAPASARAR